MACGRVWTFQTNACRILTSAMGLTLLLYICLNTIIMLKPILLSAGLFFLAQEITAQQSTPYVIASGGDYFTATTFTNSFTVGEEAVVQTSSTGSFILTQGFQQPNDGPNAILDPEVISHVIAYPNPTSGMLALHYTLAAASAVRMEVYDLSGKLLQAEQRQQQPGVQREVLDLSALANGAYFVNLRVDGRQVLVNRIHIVH